MSVILLDQQFIDRLLGMIRFYHEEVAQILQYSPYYSHYLRYTSYQDPDAILENYISRMFQYAITSNRIVYALQDSSDVSLFDIHPKYKNAKEIPCPIKQLLEKFADLNYNMLTADGNSFMSDAWYQPFEMIRNRLAQKLARK